MSRTPRRMLGTAATAAAAVAVVGVAVVGGIASATPAVAADPAPLSGSTVTLVSVDADPYYQSIGLPYAAVVSASGEVRHFAEVDDAEAAAVGFSVVRSGTGYSLLIADGGCLAFTSGAWGGTVQGRSADICSLFGAGEGGKNVTVRISPDGYLQFPGLGRTRVALTGWSGSQEVMGANDSGGIASRFLDLDLEAAVG